MSEFIKQCNVIDTIDYYTKYQKEIVGRLQSPPKSLDIIYNVIDELKQFPRLSECLLERYGQLCFVKNGEPISDFFAIVLKSYEKTNLYGDYNATDLDVYVFCKGLKHKKVRVNDFTLDNHIWIDQINEKLTYNKKEIKVIGNIIKTMVHYALKDYKYI